MARVLPPDVPTTGLQVAQITGEILAGSMVFGPAAQSQVRPQVAVPLGIPRSALPPPPAAVARLRTQDPGRLWRLGEERAGQPLAGSALSVVRTTVPEGLAARASSPRINPREVLKKELGGRLIYLAENEFHRVRTELGITVSHYFEHNGVMYANHDAVAKNPALEKAILYQLRLPRTEDLSSDIKAGGLAKNMPGIIAGVHPAEQVYCASVERFEATAAEFTDYVLGLNRGSSVAETVTQLRTLHARFVDGYGPAVRIYTRDGKRYLTSAYLEDTISEAIRDHATSPVHSAALVLPVGQWNSTLDQTRTNFLMTLTDVAAQRFFHHGVVQVQDTFGQDPGKTARVNNVLLSLQFQSDTAEEDLARFLRSLPRLIQSVIDDYFVAIPRKKGEYDDILDQIVEIFDDFGLEAKHENISRIKNPDKKRELKRLFDEAAIVSAEIDNAEHFLDAHVVRRNKGTPQYMLFDEHRVPMNLDEARLDLISGAFVTPDLAPYFAREDISPAEIQKLTWDTRSRAVSLAEYNASRNGERDKAVIGEADVVGVQIPERHLFPQGQRLSTAKMYAGLAEAKHHHANEHYTPNSKFIRLSWDRVETVAREMQALYVDFDVARGFAALQAHMEANHTYHEIPANDPAREFLALLDDFFSGSLSDNARVVFQGLGGFPSMRHFRHLAGTGTYSLAGKLSLIREKLQRKLTNRSRLSDKDIEELREIAALLPSALDFMKEASVESNGITVPAGLHAELTIRAAQKQYRLIEENTGQNIADKHIISVGIEASGFKNYDRARRTKNHARDTYVNQYKILSHDVAEYLGRQHGGAHVEVVITAPQGDEVVANFIGHDSQGRALTYGEIAEAYQVMLAQKLPGETARTEKFQFNGVQERPDLYEIGLTDRNRVVHAIRHPRNLDQFYVMEDLTRVNNEPGWITITPENVSDWKFTVPEFGELPGMEIVVNDGTHRRHFLVARHPTEPGRYYVVKDMHAEFWGEETAHDWITIAPETIQEASLKYYTLARKKLGLRLAMHRYNIAMLRLDVELDEMLMKPDVEKLNALREKLFGYDNDIKDLIKEALQRGETPPLFYEYQRRSRKN